jgi:uncharacterized membrane protein
MVFAYLCQAQEAIQGAEMADSFRQDGKIYVVTSVMGIIFIAIIVYLIVIDRNVKRLEDEFDNKDI